MGTAHNGRRDKATVPMITGAKRSRNHSGGENKPASKFWHQGFIVSADGAVYFRTAATRVKILKQAQMAGHQVVKVDRESVGYGFAPAPEGSSDG